MDFDRAQFIADCNRRRQLYRDLQEAEASITPRFPAARAAGMTIAEIMAESGGADSWVRKYAPGPARDAGADKGASGA